MLILQTDALKPIERREQARRGALLLSLALRGMRASGSVSDEYDELVSDLASDLALLTAEK